MALEGSARIVSDDLDTSVLQYGGELDLHDGKGVRRFSGLEILFLLLEKKFPENQEAMMLRQGRPKRYSRLSFDSIPHWKRAQG